MKAAIDLIDIKNRLIAVLFPERCVLCGDVVAYDDLWCGQCGLKAFGEIDSNISGNFAGALAVAEYAGGVRDAILRLKVNREDRSVLFFADLMRKAMEEHWPDIKLDLVVPVPIDSEKLKDRGFNQAEKLGARLSGLIDVPLKPDALIRHSDSRVQHALNKADRRANAAKSYDKGNVCGIEGKTVLLVDDVFTTGATSVACTDKLLLAGARRVYVITASAVKAKTQDHGEQEG